MYLDYQYKLFTLIIQLMKSHYFFNYSKIQRAMLESQKFQQIQTILAENPVLKNILNLITTIANKHNDFYSQSFIASQHFTYLLQEINKLRIPELNEVIETIKIPHCIVALPIKREQKFTLFFVIVPPGQRFDWHNHPKMTGISKCVFGHLSITSLDVRFLNQINPYSFLYPKKYVRCQSLKAESTKNVSTIQPHALNVHRIEAVQLSAFFDLLLPDYPQNMCQFLKTIDQSEEALMLRQIEEPSENIEGWDVYLKELIHNQKHIVTNVILK